MKTSLLTRVFAGLFLASVAGALPTQAAPITGLYVFGDSLSDVGNVFLATQGSVPGAPYAAGRFSNGPIWVDDLSAALGLGTVRPSLAGGTDFAFGGAVTGPAVPGATTSVPDILQQVGAFTLATGGHAPSSGLYTVWIGANDIFAALDGLSANTLTAAQAGAALTVAAQTAAAAVKALAQEGAMAFLVPLIPDLGKTPNARGAGVSAAAIATALTQGYNAALVASIQALTLGNDVAVRYLDTFSLLDSAVDDPMAFGFSNVVDKCYVGAITGGGTVCATPDSYLFWDGQHPTAMSHALIADAALQAIPEPPAVLILLTAIFGMLAFRVRSMVAAGVAGRRSAPSRP